MGAAVAVLLATVVLAACGGGGDDSSSDESTGAEGTSSTAAEPVDDHPLGGLHEPRAAGHQGRGRGIRRSHPDVTVKVVGGINDDKIIAAHPRRQRARRGVSRSPPTNVGSFCSSGGWIDLKPYPDASDKIDVNMFPQASQYYTQYKGKRCALPMLADAYGLYYNKKLFKRPGSPSRRRRCRELTDVRQEADQEEPGRRRSRSSATTPRMASTPNAPQHYGPVFGAKWVDGEGKSTLAKRPGLDEVAEVAEGPRRLVRLRQARQVPGGRWATSSRPPTRSRRGKLAMTIDGEWRVAFIADRAPRPRLRHGAAAGRRRPARALRLGLRQRHDHRHPEGRQAQGRGVGAGQVPDDRRPRAGAAVERPAQRADDEDLAEVAATSRRTRTSRCSSTSSPTRRLEHDADHGGRQPPTRSSSRASSTKWQAGQRR